MSGEFWKITDPDGSQPPVVGCEWSEKLAADHGQMARHEIVALQIGQSEKRGAAADLSSALREEGFKEGGAALDEHARPDGSGEDRRNRVAEVLPPLVLQKNPTPPEISGTSSPPALSRARRP